MSAAAFLDTLSDARTRWLNGDPLSWARYTECCLKLEAELQAAQHTCSSLESTSASSCSSASGRCRKRTQTANENDD